MPKQSGLGDNLYVDGNNVSGDIGSLSRIGGGQAAGVTTGIDKYAFERIGQGPRDGAIEFTSYFNDDSGRAHEVFSALPTTDRVVSYFRGTALGGWGASLVGKQINYDLSRATDGALPVAIAAQSNGYGLEWGRSLTAGRRTDTGAANGTGVDFGAASSFGLQAYVHVFAFTGTDATIKLQGSSDDGGSDAYADITGGGFTQVTSAPTSQRIETARNLAVERYMRVVTTTSGGFSNLVFAVLVAKNLTEVVF